MALFFLSYAIFPMEESASDDAGPSANIIYEPKIDRNPLAITTPEISDWVLGQPDRLRTDAELDQLNVELGAIENERREIANRKAALDAELAYLEGNSLVLQTQQSVALQNQLAALDIRRAETQLRLDEALGMAEALAVELSAVAVATDTAERSRIENIEREADANLAAALKQAEAERALADARRSTARVEMFEAFTLLAVGIAGAAMIILLIPLAIQHIRHNVTTPSRPEAGQRQISTRPTPDGVDDFLNGAAGRAAAAPPSRNTPPRTPPQREFHGIPQNSSENSGNDDSGGVDRLTVNYPWTKIIFTPQQLEIVADGLGSAGPAGILWSVAQMQAGQYRGRGIDPLPRREIVAALKVSGTAYRKFWADVDTCKQKVIEKAGGIRTTTTFQ